MRKHVEKTGVLTRAENVRGPDAKIGDAYTIFSDPFTEPQNRDINKPDSVVSALAH